MTEEAKIVDTGNGLKPAGPGWFVLNAAEAAWGHVEGFGSWCDFQSDHPFEQIGVNIHILDPGRPNGKYHREDQQEDFLVLAGECILIVEGQERRLKPWDFVHCPPGTDHIFVGAEAPCAILMIGGRTPQKKITYPVSEVAAKHGASVVTETNSPKEAYADAAKPRVVPTPWPAVLSAP